MKITFVSSEVYPFSKTGGLADVAGSLPISLNKIGADVKVFSPFYFDVKSNTKKRFKNISKITFEINGVEYSVNIKSAKLPNSKVDCYFIDYPEYFDRKKYYTSDKDEHLRFVLFQKAVLEFLKEDEFIPDVVHVNDWQTSLIPYYLKTQYLQYFPKTKSLLTIHNIGYQGVFDYEVLQDLEIAENLFYPMGPAEFYGQINFLKMGLIYSDLLNTVSKTYAKELLLPNLGGGMENILLQRKKDLFGIVNGVDYEVWSPEKDSTIPQNYSLKSFHKKEKSKEELKKQFGVKAKNKKPIIGMVTRMVSQKGFDLLIELEKFLVGMDAYLFILGSGEQKYENYLLQLQNETKNIKVHIGYNNSLAHLIEAGADMFLMPSMYEPCGLNQIYSLKYGTVPIVRKTGGLADTVQDWDERFTQGYEDGTGFSFVDFTPDSLQNTIERAIKTFSTKVIWQKIIENGMTKDYSWENSAKEYMYLYNRGEK